MVSGHAGAGLPILRVRHWRAAAESDEIECVFDTHPELASQPAVIVLPPCLSAPPGAQITQPFISWLRQLHAVGTTIGSVCAGAFLLAETGLLSGRPVTTHWSFAKTLGERFPDIHVQAEKLIIDDGDIITAGGVMAWTDLGLTLVDRLLGPTIASETAHFLVIDLTRHSQQYFSSFSPKLTHGDEAVLKVQHWLRAHGANDVTSSAMAAHAGLGERTFLRRFHTATGLRPIEYCQHLRVAKARELLEFTNRTVEQIAWEMGYQDPGAFRKVFHKVVGLSPRDYRRRFGGSASTRQAPSEG
ncbi:HTH-type transcriptional regulator CdhR [compost metagenome]